MSAFIVSKTHIDALVTALLARGVIATCTVHTECKAHKEMGVECVKSTPHIMATKIGKLLWLENHRSVNARYAGRVRTPKYDFARVDVDAWSLLKQISCYEYQTDEHSKWSSSEACRLMRRLRAILISEGVGVGESSPVQISMYRDAPWGL